MKKSFYLTVFTLLIFSLFAAGSSESEPEKVDSSKVNTEVEEVVEKQAEKFKIGDTVQFGDLLITVKGVRASKGDGFMTPENDNYIIVDVILENNTTETANISSILQTSLSDADGYNYNVTIAGDTKGSLDGQVGPGRKLAGEVAFDVPKSSSYEFIFEDVFTNGQAIWEFQLN
jgi:hypothetical protein